MEKNLSNEEALNKFQKLVNEINVCRFITNHPGNNHRRPMATIEVDVNGTLWFFSDVRSINMEEISADPTVHLVYAHPGKEAYLDVWGSATVNTDRQTIKNRWSPIAKAWFPNGLTDPNPGLLQVQPKGVYYWDAETGKMISFFKIAGLAVTGNRPSEGAKGKLAI